MHILVEQEKLKKTFIPKKFKNFGVHYLNHRIKEKIYDIRILWCFTHLPKNAIPTKKETHEFISLIFAPYQHEPIGIANHPILRGSTSDNDAIQLWTNKKLPETLIAIEHLEVFSNVKIPFKKKHIGNNWKKVHEFLYQND